MRLRAQRALQTLSCGSAPRALPTTHSYECERQEAVFNHTAAAEARAGGRGYRTCSVSQLQCSVQLAI